MFCRSLRWLLLCLPLVLVPAAPAQAADSPTGPRYTLRFATSVPQGTAWARIVHEFVQDIERATGGEVTVKVFYGSSAGNEAEVGERLKRGQLDGYLSGGWLCSRAMPSMHVLALIGLFQSRDEATYVIDELRPSLEEEAKKSGFVLMGTAGLGPIMVFSRQPVTSMSELKKTRLWRWEGEEVEVQLGKDMGLHAQAGTLEESSKVYDGGKVDGFFAVPAAALAFQWFAQARYLLDLRTSYLMGCALMTTRAVDALPQQHRDALRMATARLAVRFDDVSRRQDDALLGGVFAKQGLKVTPVSAKFRAEFFEAARVARDRVDDKIVPRALLAHVLQLLADYRSEHGSR
jgi:TRAP-type C4-dicarboxylate transport system substrate-binding protein